MIVGWWQLAFSLLHHQGRHLPTTGDGKGLPYWGLPGWGLPGCGLPG